MNFFQVQAILAFVAGLALAAPAPDHRSEAHAYPTLMRGGPHGEDFSDKMTAFTDHKRIAYVSMHGCAEGEHLNMLELGYRDNRDPSDVVKFIRFHGSHAEKTPRTLKLARDEWITQVRTVTWAKKIVNPITWNTRTRIGNIEMYTNKGRSIGCGAYNMHDPPYLDKPPKNDGALLYFNGREGDAVDALQANWIPTVEF